MKGYGTSDSLYVTGEGERFGCLIQLGDRKGDGLFDACILWELQKLWEQGVKTVCSCCGHGREDAAKIGVADESAALMETLGYEKVDSFFDPCVKIGMAGDFDACARHWYKAKSRLNCVMED